MDDSRQTAFLFSGDTNASRLKIAEFIAHAFTSGSDGLEQPSRHLRRAQTSFERDAYAERRRRTCRFLRLGNEVLSFCAHENAFTSRHDTLLDSALLKERMIYICRFRARKYRGHGDARLSPRMATAPRKSGVPFNARRDVIDACVRFFHRE